MDMTTSLHRLGAGAVSIGLIAAGLTLLPSAVSARPLASTHCRHQTFTWNKAKTPALNSAKGPRVRTHASGSAALTDNLVTAGLSTAGDIPARFVDVTGNTTPQGNQITRLESVTVVPVKGKTRTYKINGNPNDDEVYSRDLLKDYEQVLLPVSGQDGQGRKTPKLKKVTVTAIENCFATQ
jgi:hypothetical protein